LVGEKRGLNLPNTLKQTVTEFGHSPDGARVDRVSISNGGVTARIITWGASLQDFRHDAVPHPLVLGSPSLAPYLTRMLYFGAIAGRVANRIAGGSAMLEGRRLTLERNDKGRSTLHGGSRGSTSVNWTLEDIAPTSCQMSVVLPDGQGGFPGAVTITVVYALNDQGALSVDLTARTDAPTFCNLAHHSYWNLDGSADISRHKLWVNADRYLPLDGDQIPLDAPLAVAGTPFDFRQPRTPDTRLDHNFCLNDALGLRPACTFEGGGLRLTVETTEPGLQVYDGFGIDTQGDLGLQGAPYGSRAGLALEPQRWPDAPNHPDFPSILLRPDQTYRQTSVFRVENCG
jgi:aldose 1-epimerase